MGCAKRKVWNGVDGGSVPVGPKGIDTVPAVTQNGLAMLDSQEGAKEYVLTPEMVRALGGEEVLDQLRFSVHDFGKTEARREMADGGVLSQEEGQQRASSMVERMMAQARREREAAEAASATPATSQDPVHRGSKPFGKGGLGTIGTLKARERKILSYADGGPRSPYDAWKERKAQRSQEERQEKRAETKEFISSIPSKVSARVKGGETWEEQRLRDQGVYGPSRGPAQQGGGGPAQQGRGGLEQQEGGGLEQQGGLTVGAGGGAFLGSRGGAVAPDTPFGAPDQQPPPSQAQDPVREGQQRGTRGPVYAPSSFEGAPAFEGPSRPGALPEFDRGNVPAGPSLEGAGRVQPTGGGSFSIVPAFDKTVHDAQTRVRMLRKRGEMDLSERGPIPSTSTSEGGSARGGSGQQYTGQTWRERVDAWNKGVEERSRQFHENAAAKNAIANLPRRQRGAAWAAHLRAQASRYSADRGLQGEAMRSAGDQQYRAAQLRQGQRGLDLEQQRIGLDREQGGRDALTASAEYDRDRLNERYKARLEEQQGLSEAKRKRYESEAESGYDAMSELFSVSADSLEPERNKVLLPVASNAYSRLLDLSGDKVSPRRIQTELAREIGQAERANVDFTDPDQYNMWLTRVAAKLGIMPGETARGAGR